MIDKDIEIEFLNAQLDYVTEQLKEERLICQHNLYLLALHRLRDSNY